MPHPFHCGEGHTAPPPRLLTRPRGSPKGGTRLQECTTREGPQRSFDRRLEEVATAVGGSYCRLQMPLKLAFGVWETVARHRLGPWKGGRGLRSAIFRNFSEFSAIFRTCYLLPCTSPVQKCCSLGLHTHTHTHTATMRTQWPGPPVLKPTNRELDRRGRGTTRTMTLTKLCPNKKLPSGAPKTRATQLLDAVRRSPQRYVRWQEESLEAQPGRWPREVERR